jgi:hypothetical protein
MAGPIYKMFRGRMKDPWFQLPSEEQEAILNKTDHALKTVGGKRVLLCNSYWASEKWWFWGVEEFPSIEAVQEYARCLDELDWMHYCDSETLLGNKAGNVEPA